MEDTSLTPRNELFSTGVLDYALTGTGLVPGTWAALDMAKVIDILSCGAIVTSAAKWDRADVTNEGYKDVVRLYEAGEIDWNRRNELVRNHTEFVAQVTNVTTATIEQDRSIAEAWPYEYRVFGRRVNFNHHKVLHHEFPPIDGQWEGEQRLGELRDILLRAEEEGLSSNAMLQQVREMQGMKRIITSAPRNSIVRWFKETGLQFRPSDDNLYAELRRDGVTIIATSDTPIRWEIAHDMES